MARVRFTEIVAIAALAGSLAACGNTSAPTAAPATSTSTEQAGPTTSAAATPALSTSTATSSQTPSSTPTTTAPDPTKVVAGSWLPASQFPLIGKMAWQLDPYHSSTAGVAVNSAMEEQAAFYICQPEQLAHAGVKGLQSRDYHLDPAPSPDNKQVQQIQLFFTDSASAKAGRAAIEGWHSNCTAGPSQKTASTPDGTAYLVTNGGTTHHEYFVQRGAVIGSIVITGYDAAAPSVKGTSQDKATLGAMASLLCAYNSAC